MNTPADQFQHFLDNPGDLSTQNLHCQVDYNPQLDVWRRSYEGRIWSPQQSVDPDFFPATLGLIVDGFDSPCASLRLTHLSTDAHIVEHGNFVVKEDDRAVDLGATSVSRAILRKVRALTGNVLSIERVFGHTGQPDLDAALILTAMEQLFEAAPREVEGMMAYVEEGSLTHRTLSAFQHHNADTVVNLKKVRTWSFDASGSIPLAKETVVVVQYIDAARLRDAFAYGRQAREHLPLRQIMDRAVLGPQAFVSHRRQRVKTLA